MNNTLALVRDDGPTLPALIDRAGERAVWRYLEFFTVNIRNVNTRAAYGLAAGRFLRWCEGRGITRIEDVQPMHVAAYIEGLGKVRKAPTVKQHLACIRMLFDWLVTGQVLPSNPAHAVRGPRHSVIKGATTVMSSQETSEFLKNIDTAHVVDLRDRAFIAVMVYAFARVSAVVSLKVEDYFPLQKRWWLRLREKGGKVNEMGCHHKLEQYLDLSRRQGSRETRKVRCSAPPSAGRASCPSGPCRVSMHGTWCADGRWLRASRRQSAIILSDPSVSRTIWSAAATLTSPSGWQVTRTSKRRNSTTGAATK
jgi:integrase